MKNKIILLRCSNSWTRLLKTHILFFLTHYKLLYLSKQITSHKI